MTDSLDLMPKMRPVASSRFSTAPEPPPGEMKRGLDLVGAEVAALPPLVELGLSVV